jgi:phage virion morphogenesis protein
MADEFLSVTVSNTAVVDQLSALSQRMGNLSPVMRDIGQGLEREIIKRFASQRDPNGAAWHPLAKSTALNRARTGAKGGILEHYGTMLQSLSFEAGSNSVRVGFTQPYAVFHEFGTKKMPRRGMLFGDPNAGTLGASDEALVLDLIGDYLAV